MGASIPKNLGSTKDPFAESFDAGCRKGGVRRLLVPFKEVARLESCLCYARNLEAAGVGVHLSLLHVVAAAPRGDLTARTAAGLFCDAGDVATRSLVDQAASRLAGTTFRHSFHVRRGDVVFTIFDVAEQIGCDEVVLPMPRPSLLPRIFSQPIAHRIMRLNRAVPVVVVDAEGLGRTAARGQGANDMPVLSAGGEPRSSGVNAG